MSTLRSLRERKGLTVSQLAGKASIPSRVITDYEEGKLPITLAHAKLLAKALWVGIEDLMPPAGAIPPASVHTPPAQTPPPVQRQAPPPTASRPVQSPPSPQRPPADASGGQSQGQGYRQDTRDYTSAPGVRTDTSRPPRPASYEVRDAGHAGHGHQRGAGDTTGSGRPARPARPAPPPPSVISEGQVQELERLAAKLEVTVEQLEERIGKKVLELTRPEAKEWIKRVRGMAEELAPSRKASYGQWPGGHVDQEAAYLAEQKEAAAYFRFKLFNGEEIGGVITDFTPYTITVSSNGVGDDTVLRKLAIAYYRRGEPSAITTETLSNAASVPTANAAPPKRTRASKAQTSPPAHDHERDDHHQPLDAGVNSDRPNELEAPEADNMDEDRGL